MRILVVDDDPTVRELLSLQLGLAGHDVTTACDGDDGLAAVGEQAPDLVVLDVMMPRMSGWQVLEHLQAEPTSSRPRVLLLTARDLPDDRRRGYELGASAVLSKPPLEQELLDVVAALGVRTDR